MQRREFLKSTTLAASSFASPAFHRNAFGFTPNQQINVAMIGCGGRGGKNLASFGPLANICALTDVNTVSKTVEGARELYPQVPFFTDYRKMFDKMSKEIDAVVVSTPDHSHFAATKWALSLENLFTRKNRFAVRLAKSAIFKRRRRMRTWLLKWEIRVSRTMVFVFVANGSMRDLLEKYAKCDYGQTVRVLVGCRGSLTNAQCRIDSSRI